MLRLVAIPVAPTLVSAGFLAPTASEACTNSPGIEGKLHFLSNRPGGKRNGNWDVYRANLDGSGVERVTDFPSHSVRWFDFHRGTRTLVLAGSSKGNLGVGPSGNDGGPAVAEEIIATVARNGRTTVLINVLDRSKNPEGFNSVWHPTFSPDGKRIVFAASRKGQSNNLWSINRNGSGLKAIDPDPHRTQNDPRFGRNGKVVYVRHGSKGFGQLTNPGGLDVWMIDPTRPGDNTKLTNEKAIPGAPGLETDPALSPNCRYVAVNWVQSLSRNANVVMRADGRSSGYVEVLNSRQAGGFRPGPTWIDNQRMLSYRWNKSAKGWRIILVSVKRPGKFQELNLGAPRGYRDVMPVAY